MGFLRFSKGVAVNPRAPIYVNANEGCDKNNGASWASPLMSMAEALRRVRRGGTIYFYGKLLEDGLVTPVGITDVTVIGAAPRPREGNHGRTAGPKGGAADWRYREDSTTNPLLHVTQQGWRFENIMIRGAENGGGILLTRTLEAETTEQGFAGDHATFAGCVFQGPSQYGICQEGGVINVQITDCMFRRFTAADTWAILGRTGEGVGWPLFWRIQRNWFVGNYGNVKVGLVNSIVSDNISQKSAVLNPNPMSAVMLDLAGGMDNTVRENC